MTAIPLPAVPWEFAYPQIMKSVSAARAGAKAMAFIEWADDVWMIQMRTKPLNPRERILAELFRDKAQDGLRTVLYKPQHMCVPQAYWGNANAAALSNAGNLVSITDGRTLSINSVDTGLVLTPGDLISLATGDYRALCRVQTGGTAVANAVTVTVEPPVKGYIASTAVVAFKNPELNMRVMPGSFAIPDEEWPVASFTLVEVPK